jgi:membrane associated rhomboid family serine protease/Flp pilus assembly protein TadD
MSDQPIIITTPPRQPPFIRRRYTPIATLVILALNVAIFMLMEFAGGSKNPEVLLNFGASYGPFIRRGEYWRLVMPMFLHIGLPHLILNTLGLFVLGRILETIYGYGRFALLYVASGMGGVFLSITLSRHVSAGASGAIFGIAGAMLTVGYLHRAAVPRRWRRAFGGGILPLIVLNLFLGFSIPGIDNWGHVGGLFVGMLASGLIPPPGLDWDPDSTPAEPSQAMVIIPMAIVVLAMSAAVEHHRASQAIARLIEDSRKMQAAGRIDQALQRAQEAARLAPHDDRTHEQLGSLYLRQGQTEEAIREFGEARRLNPLSVPAQRGLARAYRRKGDTERAARIFEDLLGEDANTSEGKRLLGDLYLEEKLYAEAIENYQRALELNPEDAATHNNLGWLLATADDPQFRDPKGALEHAQKAVALNKWKEAAFIDTLAEALFVNGKLDEAVETQTRALKLDPDNQEYQEHMARYRKAAGV